MKNTSFSPAENNGEKKGVFLDRRRGGTVTVTVFTTMFSLTAGSLIVTDKIQNGGTHQGRPVSSFPNVSVFAFPYYNAAP